MFAAWALLKRQYGNLPCTSSVGLLLRVYDVCVPATASYGCEVWACQRFPAAARTERAVLPRLHLQILKQILGLRKTVPTELDWREVPVKRLQDTWWQRTVTFWNSLAAAPITSLYRRIALASCRSAVARNVHNWAWSFYRGVRAIGYMWDIRVDDMDPIAEATFMAYLFDVHAASWHGLVATWQRLSVNPRSCPSGSPLACAHTMLGLLGLPMLTARLYSGWLCRTSVCRLSSNLDWAVTTSPGMWVAGLQYLGNRNCALSAMLVCQAMSTTLCLSVRPYNMFVTSILGCLGNMLGQCFSLYGRQICVGLPDMSPIV